MMYQDGDQVRGDLMNRDDQNQSNSGRYGDRDFRGQERYGESSQGRYGQGGYGQDDSRRSHRGDWGQGRMEPRGHRDDDRYGEYADGSAGGYSGQRRPTTSATFTYTEVWLIPGPHTGRGPRGYQRSNQRIEEDVCERLSQHGQLDASEIQVHVEDGEVTLTGTVSSRAEKRMAEDALDSITGIKDVHNQLRVQKDQSQQQGSSGKGQDTGNGRSGENRERQGSSGMQNGNASREQEPASASAS